MMRLLLTLALFAFLQTSIYAQARMDATVRTVVINENVPKDVSRSFKLKYPNIAVKDWDWEDRDDLYKAEFDVNGQEYEAYFSPDGRWQHTKRRISERELPSAVMHATTRGKYRSWAIGNTVEIETPDYGKLYLVKFQVTGAKEYKLFNDDGKVIEQEEE